MNAASVHPRGKDHPFFDGLDRVIAHQGGAGRDRGNQLAAFRRARDEGFGVIDVDVVGTADGELFVFHDPYLSRLATGGGEVHQVSATYIDDEVEYRRRYRAAGSTTPQLDRLTTVLDEFDGMKFSVEVKNAAALHPLTELLDSLGQMRLARFALSGKETECAVLRERYPTAMHSLTKSGVIDVVRRRRWPDGIDCAQLPFNLKFFDTHRVSWVRSTLGRIKVPRSMLALLTDRVLHAATKAGAPTIYWTTDDVDEARWAFDRGAVSVYSDRPVELRAALAT